MKKALGSLTALLLLIVMLPAAAEAAEGQGMAVYYEYMEYDQNTGEDFYDPDTGRITGKWRVGGGYHDENGAWHEIEGEAQYVDAPPSGAEVQIINAIYPVELMGDFSNLLVLNADLTVCGNVERAGIPYYSDPGMAAVTTLTVYGDIGELDFHAEHSDGCSVYLTGNLRLGVAEYDLDVSSFADSQRYFAWKGDGTTLAAVVLGGQATQPTYSGSQIPYEGPTPATSESVGVTLPPYDDIIAAAGLEAGSVALSVRSAALDDEQKSAMDACQQAQGHKGRTIAVYSIRAQDLVNGGTLAPLEAPVPVTLTIPSSLQAEGETLDIYRLCPGETGAYDVTALGSFAGNADSVELPFDRSGIYVISRTGGPDSRMVYLLGGGAVAVLILGGIIAVSVVKKREKTAGDAL